MKLVRRSEVPQEETWDLSLIYSTEAEMYADAARLSALADRMVEEYQGKLSTPEQINSCLDDLRTVQELMALTGSYTDLAVAVDYTDSYNQEREAKIAQLRAQVSAKLSFINTEITAQPEEVLEAAIAQTEKNKGYLRDLLRLKPHQLNPDTERALAALSQTLDAPYQIYNLTKMADMKFEPFTVEEKEYPLGYALYENDYEHEENTSVRRTAFRGFYKKLREYENVTAAAYNTQVQEEKTLATLRGFDSVFDSLLFPQKVSRELYDRQIDLIMEKLAPYMRKYARLLQKIHGLDRMTFADTCGP